MSSQSWKRWRLTPQRPGAQPAQTELLETAAIAALDARRKRKLTLAAQARVSNVRRPDWLLKAKEVAEWLGVADDWVYHKHRELLFRVRLGTVPRFSEKGLEEYIRKRLGT